MKFVCLRLRWVADVVGFEFLGSILVHLLLDAQCFGKIVIFPDFAFLADWAQDPLFVLVVLLLAHSQWHTVLVVLLAAHSQWHMSFCWLLTLVMLLVAHPQRRLVVTPPAVSPASIFSLYAFVMHI